MAVNQQLIGKKKKNEQYSTPQMVFVLNICTQHHRGQKHISNSEEYTFINMDRKGIPHLLGFSHNNPEAIHPSTLPKNKDN